MPSADEFDTCAPASQQTQYCKSTDVDRAPPHGCEDAAPAQGDHRQRHGHARPELPPRGGSVPRLAARRAVAAVQARGAERPERLLARASAASPHIPYPNVTRRTWMRARCRASPRKLGLSNTSAPSVRPSSPRPSSPSWRVLFSGDGRAGAARRRRRSRGRRRRRRRPELCS